MSKEKHTDTSNLEKLEALVQSRGFLNQELDRLLAWEWWQRYLLGKSEEPMHPSEFCDKMGVGPRFTNGINDAIREKVRRRNYEE